MTASDELIIRLFKTEYRKIISVLCKLFSIQEIEIAEDIVNETFLQATETWREKGIPQNPAAWLYTVAKNKTHDYLKRNNLFAQKIKAGLNDNSSQAIELELDLSGENIKDSQLRMLFAICHPQIPVEAQIGLALRLLCGFGIDEIAEAFLTNKETINKRLFRAKEKLRTTNIDLNLPHPSDIDARLNNVLSIIYLLFNEGYYSLAGNKILRKDLCLEAMYLCYLLLENEHTTTPPVNALMALMCFHSSRFEARENNAGEIILYDEQNRDDWNDELIHKGNYYLTKSATGKDISKYHLEASIAYWHCSKIENPEKWQHILQLYNKLLQLNYSPSAALNRTYAYAQIQGKLAAIKEAEKLNLTENHLWYSLLGYLYTDINTNHAIKNYSNAMRISKTNSERNLIQKALNQLIRKADNS
jgi:RNA polymerase sigma factor (sigma-70 family)